jgi:uncharacterized protein
MDTQEREKLEQFLDGLVAVKGVNKLPEPEQLIRRAVAQQPDAVYLLVQRCMLLDLALSQAKARIAALEEAQGSSGSFLEGGYQPTPAPRYSSPPPGVAPPAPPPMYAAPVGGGAGSFLGQAAATAAGVAGGEFLFEGLEHLFGGHNPGFGPAGFAGAPNEEVTINNYYENADDRHREDMSDVDDDRPDDDNPDHDNPDDDTSDDDNPDDDNSFDDGNGDFT